MSLDGSLSLRSSARSSTLCSSPPTSPPEDWTSQPWTGCCSWTAPRKWTCTSTGREPPPRVNPRKLQAPQSALEACLARDAELKATAQRGYFKAMFLMKDKDVFDVTALDSAEYAKSLGLAVSPRIRFLERKNKAQQLKTKSEEASEEEELEREEEEEAPQSQQSYDFKSNLSESEVDVLTLKRRDHALEGAPVAEGSEGEPQKSITKAAQCEKIVAKYGFTHLSSGDLLRAEVASGSPRGQQLNATMERGELVPLEVVLDLLKEAMVSRLAASKGYLLDGYPREAAQGEQFERELAPCSLVLFFNCSDATLTERLLKRGQSSGRVDDNEDTIKKRLDTFHQHSQPIVHNCAAKCTDRSTMDSKTTNQKKPLAHVPPPRNTLIRSTTKRSHDQVCGALKPASKAPEAKKSPAMKRPPARSPAAMKPSASKQPEPTPPLAAAAAEDGADEDEDLINDEDVILAQELTADVEKLNKVDEELRDDPEHLTEEEEKEQMADEEEEEKMAKKKMLYVSQMTAMGQHFTNEFSGDECWKENTRHQFHAEQGEIPLGGVYAPAGPSSPQPGTSGMQSGAAALGQLGRMPLQMKREEDAPRKLKDKRLGSLTDAELPHEKLQFDWAIEESMKEALKAGVIPDSDEDHEKFQEQEEENQPMVLGLQQQQLDRQRMLEKAPLETLTAKGKCMTCPPAGPSSRQPGPSKVQSATAAQQPPAGGQPRLVPPAGAHQVQPNLHQAAASADRTHEEFLKDMVMTLSKEKAFKYEIDPEKKFRFEPKL